MCRFSVFGHYVLFIHICPVSLDQRQGHSGIFKGDLFRRDFKFHVFTSQMRKCEFDRLRDLTKFCKWAQNQGKDVLSGVVCPMAALRAGAVFFPRTSFYAIRKC